MTEDTGDMRYTVERMMAVDNRISIAAVSSLAIGDMMEEINRQIVSPGQPNQWHLNPEWQAIHDGPPPAYQHHAGPPVVFGHPAWNGEPLRFEFTPAPTGVPPDGVVQEDFNVNNPMPADHRAEMLRQLNQCADLLRGRQPSREAEPFTF